MDINFLHQISGKKSWAIDVIFYLSVSLLISVLFCYVIFSVKIGLLEKEIKDETARLESVGTQEQKAQEKAVLDYIKKINDFAGIFKNHQLASNAFAFIQKETLPYVWFKQFGLDRKNGSIQVTGQTENMDNYSRQIANFEKNKYVKSVGTLNSTIGSDGKINFGVNLTMNDGVFKYIEDLSLERVLANAAAENGAEAVVPVEEEAGSAKPAGLAKSSLKLLIVFDFPSLSPQVSAKIDQVLHTVTAEVPEGTDVKNLAPVINISPKAVVSPASGAAKDFSSPVVYQVKAEDGSVQQYTASIKFVKPPKNQNSQSSSVWIILVSISSIVVAAAALAAIFIFKKMKSDKSTV